MNKKHKVIYNIIKQDLYRLFIVNRKTSKQISIVFGCSQPTIYKRLKEFNISLIKHYRKILTKKFLEREYIKNKKSMNQIAKEIRCSQPMVSHKLKKYNIKKRNLQESIKLLNNKGKNNGMFGRHHTAKAKKKMSKKLKGKFKGKNNPNYGKKNEESANWKGGRTKKHYCIDCGKEITYNTWYYGLKRCCSCTAKLREGKNSPNWQGGKSFEPYPIIFTKQLKDLVRVRDNFICQLCGIPELECNERLSIHHIDYDKDNCDINNLISTCRQCNARANGNKDYHYAYFMYVTNQEIGI